MSTVPASDQDGRQQLRTLVTGALYVVSTAAVVQAIEAFVDNPMSAAVIIAAAVSLIAARADVQNERFVARARKRMAWGLLIAVAATAAAVLTVLGRGGTFELSGISAAGFYGVAEAVGIGYAREVWLRGIPLAFAKRAGVPDRHAFTFAALAGVAIVLLEPNTHIEGVVLTAASSAAFTALWIRSGDGYAATTAHIAWVWLMDAAVSGEVFLLGLEGSKLTAQAGAHGPPALMTAIVFAVITVLILLDKIPMARLAARDFEDADR